MESPGEYLKRERELRGVSLRRMHESIRVPMKSLEALEADRYDSLPHPAFVKGYIKACCKELGLDENDAVLRYEMFMKERSERAEPGEAPAAQPVKREPTAQLASRNIVKPLVVAGVLLIAGFYLLSSRREPVEPVAPAAVGEEPAQKASLPPTDAPIPVEPGKETAPIALEIGTAEAPVTGHVLKVEAVEDSWIKMEIDGGGPKEVFMRKGEATEWRASEKFSIVIGNAGGVRINFDGKNIPVPGRQGEVVSIRLPS